MGALAAPSASASHKFQLKYFDIRGAAEGARLLLALAGEEYDDARYGLTPGKMESPTFDAAKEAGELVTNLDRAPVLITPEGVAIGQSKAIERFLAKQFGFMGTTNVEAALIDCIAEHCRDVKDAQTRKRFSAFVKDRTDEDKARAQREWFEDDLPAMLAKVEAAVGAGDASNGCAVGKAISYADVAIYSLLKECFPAYREATLLAAKDCPLLLEICDTVANNPKIKEWVEKRPESMM